jgi:hypothetical protein
VWSFFDHEILWMERGSEVQFGASDFGRIAVAQLHSRLNDLDLADATQNLWGATRHKHLVAVTRAAVDAGATAGTWGNELATSSRTIALTFSKQVVELSLLGKLTARQRVPMFATVPYVSAASEAVFVAEGAHAPAVAPTFLPNRVFLPQKIVTIATCSKELLKHAEAAAAAINRSLIDGLVRGINKVLTGTGAATATAPPGLANLPGAQVFDGAGITTTADFDDLARTMVEKYLAIGGTLARAVWLMPSKLAVGLAMQRDALGQAGFPTMTATGGTLYGIAAYAADGATDANLVLVDSGALACADTTDVRIVPTDEAAILQSDDGGTHVVPIFGTDSVALRATLDVSWRLAGNLATAATGVVLPAGGASTA